MSPLYWSNEGIKTYLTLIRAPGVFSVFSNVLASFFIYQHLLQSGVLLLPDLALLLFISLCCYQFGMITNDIVDVEEDGIERPFRPLPSGKFPLKVALIISVLLAIIALSTALYYSLTLLVSTVLLVLMILSYNFMTKKTPAGIYNMGAVRLLNWLLVIGLGAHFELSLVLIASIVMCYTTIVTRISQDETEPFSNKLKPYLLTLILLPVALIIYLTYQHIFTVVGGILLITFFIWLAQQVYYFQQTQVNDVQHWVTNLLKAMVILDGLLLIAINQWLLGVVCLSFLFFSGKLAKIIYMT